MYTPQQPGIPHTLTQKVLYKEHFPQDSNKGVVYCYWELKTQSILDDDFTYLILPDTCIDIVFDVNKTPGFDGALIMTPNLSATTINLKKSFSYVGIRLLPGAWLNMPRNIVGKTVFANKLGKIDLLHIWRMLSDASSFYEKIKIFEQFATDCKKQSIIKESFLLRPLISKLDTIRTVDDISKLTGYSRRHIQRIFQEKIGYSPHDFLKIIRFQQSLVKKDNHTYVDQSHYIKEFKRITNMTPKVFYVTF